MSSTGVQTVREWKICKTGAGINQHFFTEDYQGRKTENRKCIKCEEVVTASNSGTSTMNKHYKRCSVSSMPLKRPSGQSHLNIYFSFSSIFFIFYIKQCSLDIQRENAGANVAIKVIKFLKDYSVCSPTVAHPIKTVLKKWIDKTTLPKPCFLILDRFMTFGKKNVKVN